MQSGTSRTIRAGNSQLGGASKGKTTAGQTQNSRTKNTSGGNSGSSGGRIRVECNGRDVTPKSLVPSLYQTQKPDAAGSAGQPGVDQGAAGAEAAAGGAGGAGGEEQAQPAREPPHERLRQAKPAGLTREEMERNIDIALCETDTDTLLFFPSLCVALDNPQSATVSARNKAYEELCASKAESDQYREQHAQTLNHAHKSKEVFAAPPTQESVEVNANGWDIYDTFATDTVPKHVLIQQACDRESALTVSEAVKKPGCLFTMTEPYPTSDAGKETTKKKDDPKGTRKRGVTGGVTGMTRDMGGSATTTKQLGGGPTSTSLDGGQSRLATVAEDREGASATPQAEAGEKGDSSPAPGDDAEESAAAEPAPTDPIPWKAGADSPIPGELLQQLRVMERIVSQNVFHKQHMIYRNYPTLEELAKLDELREARGTEAALGAAPAAPEAAPEGAGGIPAEDGDELDDEGPLQEGSPEEADKDKAALQDLFCFNAPQLTQDMTVTCAEWNRSNQDLLAVSYGDTSPVPNAHGGFVLFWSLKNPTYPERVIRTPHGVTSLHFSSAHSNMIAAGCHDGSVMIWDLRQARQDPVLRSGSSISTNNNQKHTDIVWETRWVDQGPDKQPPEQLVSVSSDGSVLQWSMKKGLEQQALMQLKRVQNPFLGCNAVYGHKEGIVFRKSSGFCIDFPRHDPSTYLVGTEDGLVHRCSTSYGEQYLETYLGHSGPVYKVRCNPFMSHAFLTCSADWTMKLWTTKPIPGHVTENHLMNFQSTDLTDAVNDVIWAPQDSTSFAAAMDDGRVELWDLSETQLDPIVVHYPQGIQNRRRRTCVRFAPTSPVLIAGDDKGSVDVMRMYNTNQSYYSDQEQQDRLNSVMIKKR